MVVEILDMVDEVLLHILKHLLPPGARSVQGQDQAKPGCSKDPPVPRGYNGGHEDDGSGLEALVHLSETCARFKTMVQDRELIQGLLYDFHWNFHISKLRLKRFLHDPVRMKLLSQLSLNDMYWIPSWELRDMVLKLVHLKGLHVAGIRFSWVHLGPVLKKLKRLEGLSWSWDSIASEPYMFNCYSEELLRLKFLLIHVPSVVKTAPGHCVQTLPAPGAMTYMISMCQNLEELLIFSFSCPRLSEYPWMEPPASIPVERLYEEEYGRELKLQRLHTFVLNVVHENQVKTLKLFTTIINSLAREDRVNPLRKFWIDHPLGSLVHQERRWPTLDLTHVSAFSIPMGNPLDNSNPLLQLVLNLKQNSLDKCEELQISQGNSLDLRDARGVRVPHPLSQVHFATKLRTFCSRKFCACINWKTFVANHEDLEELNVAQDDFRFRTQYCAELLGLRRLRKLAVPPDVLDRVVDEKIASQFFPTVSKADKQTQEFNSSDSESESCGTYSDSSDSCVVVSESRPLCGLDILTQEDQFPFMEEFELGFTIGGGFRDGALVCASISRIQNWRKLKKLTLDSIPLQNFQFLVGISRSCRLESLRLRNLGPGTYGESRIYVDGLVTAMRNLDELRDFRFEMNLIQPSLCESNGIVEFFEALQSCTKLQRFFFDVNSWLESRLDPNSVIQLMTTCTQLSVLYLRFPSTPLKICQKLERDLKKRFGKDRPALHVIIREDFDLPLKKLTNYPSIHYRELVAFAPHICNQLKFPYPSSDPSM